VMSTRTPTTAGNRSKQELDAEADEALAAARSMPSGPEKAEAMKTGAGVFFGAGRRRLLMSVGQSWRPWSPIEVALFAWPAQLGERDSSRISSPALLTVHKATLPKAQPLLSGDSQSGAECLTTLHAQSIRVLHPDPTHPRAVG
jgi:hypothetical protein